MYDAPLLEVIGLSPTRHNFHVAFGFMKDEKLESFLWALRRVKELFGHDNMPGEVVTDREWALMNAVEHVFPSSLYMLCRRHVEYKVAVAEMVQAWGPKLPAIVDYVHKIWLDLYKERFVSVWTKNILHFGARPTNRVESAHAQLKSYIGTAIGAFHVIFPKIHDCIEAQLNEIKGEMEKSRTSKPHIFMYHLFSHLKFKITRNAIGKIQAEYDRCKHVGTDVMACDCENRTSYGLPCAHEMGMLPNKKCPIDVNDIHAFWKTLDMDMCDFHECEHERKIASDQLNELFVMIKE
ncbi:hypothetical protein RDABS01_000745 [Bienertia sinuspersici]